MSIDEVAQDQLVADEVNPEYLKKTLKKKLRWVALGLCCFFVIGNYFSYDNPGALITSMMAKLKYN